MSEHDSGSGPGRKGFVRDVMRRISPAGPRAGGDADPMPEREERTLQSEMEQLQDAIRFFGADSTEFRRRLDRLMAEFEALRRRYDLTRDRHAVIITELQKRRAANRERAD